MPGAHTKPFNLQTGRGAAYLPATSVLLTTVLDCHNLRNLNFLVILQPGRNADFKGHVVAFPGNNELRTVPENLLGTLLAFSVVSINLEAWVERMVAC